MPCEAPPTPEAGEEGARLCAAGSEGGTLIEITVGWMPQDVSSSRYDQERQEIEDSELVARCLDGSEDAFRELVQRYQRPVFSLIVRMVRDRALADDLAQEAFLKAYRALSSFDPRRKFSSWLFKIAHNATIDHLRRSVIPTQPLDDDGADRRSKIDSVEDESVRSPEDLSQSSALGEALEKAIGSLRADYREVILLRFVEGFAYQEIADITGLALGTVKTNIHRARKELASLLTDQGWGSEDAEEAEPR